MLASGTMYLDDLLVNPEFMEKLNKVDNPYGKIDPKGKQYVDGSNKQTSFETSLRPGS